LHIQTLELAGVPAFGSQRSPRTHWSYRRSVTRTVCSSCSRKPHGGTRRLCRRFKNSETCPRGWKKLTGATDAREHPDEPHRRTRGAAAAAWRGLLGALSYIASNRSVELAREREVEPVEQAGVSAMEDADRVRCGRQRWTPEMLTSGCIEAPAER
jgi:hypothetical protein